MKSEKLEDKFYLLEAVLARRPWLEVARRTAIALRAFLGIFGMVCLRARRKFWPLKQYRMKLIPKLVLKNTSATCWSAAQRPPLSPSPWWQTEPVNERTNSAEKEPHPRHHECSAGCKCETSAAKESNLRTNRKFWYVITLTFYRFLCLRLSFKLYIQITIIIYYIMKSRNRLSSVTNRIHRRPIIDL